MSAVRVEKLKSLLSRVQERRAAPRLREVAASAPTVPQPSPEPVLGVANTMQDLRQVSASLPEPVKEAPLVLEDVQLSAAEPIPLVTRKPESARSLTPAASAPPAAARPVETGGPAREQELKRSSDLFESVPPLAAATEPASLPPAQPAPEAPLIAPTARVEAPLLSRSEPVVRVVSSPRVEAPKSFGELLEASLSLRPR
jgi:hypothetical protein